MINGITKGAEIWEDIKLSLLNPNSKNFSIIWIENFITKEGIDVFEDDSKIGSLKELPQTMTQNFGYFDNKQELILSMEARKKGFSDSLNLFDESKNFLGMCDRSYVSDTIQLKNKERKKFLICKRGKQDTRKESQETIMNFLITDGEDKEIATLIVIQKNLPHEKKGFLSKLRRKSKKTSTLEIITPETDRKLLLGFFLLSLSFIFAPGSTGA